MKTYSTYEVKARFSEVLRRVRAGERVLITFHGREVAEIRPIEAEPRIEDRVRRLEERGVLSAPTGARRPWKTIARRPGALRRFLAERE